MVHVLPVGQGDCTLIQCPDGDISIVDMGKKDHKDDTLFWNAKEIKKYFGVSNSGLLGKVSKIFITHWHEDHYNLIDQVFNSEVLKGIHLYAPASPKGNFPTQVSKLHTNGQSVPLCNDYIMDIIPSNPTGRQPPSLIFYLRSSRSTFSMLFPGDVDKRNAMPQNIKPLIFKLSHHGSETNNQLNKKTYISSLKPKYIFVSGNPWHSYKHPRCSVLKVAKSILRTFTNTSFRDVAASFMCGNRGFPNPERMSTGSKPLYTTSSKEGYVNVIQFIDEGNGEVGVKIHERQFGSTQSTNRGKRDVHNEDTNQTREYCFYCMLIFIILCITFTPVPLQQCEN